MAVVSQEKVIRIRIDSTGAQAGVRNINAQLNSIGQAGTPAAAAIGRIVTSMNGASTAAGRAAANTNTLGGALGNMGGHAATAAAELTSVGTASSHASGGILSMISHLGVMTLQLAGIGFLTAGIHDLAEAFIESSNEATEVVARLAVVTKNSNELATAQSNVAAIANQTRSAMNDVAELYQKLGIQADHLGLSQSGVTMATKTFAETLKISGATTQQAQGSMRQLGEAFDVGKLSGVHYMAMMTDNIVFMRLLAQSMGVPIGKLKELSHEGKVTADELKKALTDPALAAEVQKRFDKMPIGFPDVRMAIKNTLVQLAGDFGEGAGLNSALRGLYDKIVDFATSAKPTFEKIGVAFRAAVQEFGPVVSEALGLIKPMFAFVLDNAPELIKLVKVGAESWLAYRAATALASGINIASTFLTQAQSLAALMKAATGAGTVMSYLKAGFETAAAGVDVLTGAIAANPLGALALAVTAVVGLLYTFRDSINLGGGSVASLGDLMRATWEAVGPMIGTAIDWLKSLATYVEDGLGSAFSWIAGIFGTTFDGLDFSIAGGLRAIARFVDYSITGFKAWWAVGSTIFNDVPGLLQSVFANGANLALAALEQLANGAKDIVNNIIGGMNAAFGTKVSLMADVKLGRVQTGDFGAKLGNALSGVSKTHGAESGLEGLLDRADQIHAARVKTAASSPGALETPAKEGEGGEDGKKDKAAEARAKKEKEFWDALNGQVKSAGMLANEAEVYNKQLDYRKIVNRDLTDDENKRIATAISEINTAKAITTLKQGLFEAQNAYTVELDRGVGLTEQQRAVEDAIFKLREAALNKGVNINAADYKINEGKLATQLAIVAAQKEHNDLLAKAGEFAKKYSAAFDSQSQIADLDKQKAAFEEAYTKGGGMLDGQAITKQMHDAIIAGVDNARADLMHAPLIANLQIAAGGSLIAQANLDRATADKDYNAQKTAIYASGLSPEDMSAELKEIDRTHLDRMLKANSLVADKFVSDLTDGIKEIGELFGGVLGDALGKVADVINSMEANANGSSGIAKLAGLIDGDFKEGFGQSTKSMMSIGEGIKSIGDPLKSLKEGFDGPTGSIAKGIGKAVGGAVQGAQMGQAIGSLMSAVGIKHGETGATIGGTLGGLTGNPVIAAIGSAVGGLIGSLLYKPKYSTAGFAVNADGTVGAGAVRGSNAQLKTAATGAAGEVIAGLQSIASSLGGTLTGAPNLAIGTWDGKWRVNDNATNAKLNYNNFNDSTLHDFGDDEASAVAYAIKKALTQGLITGLDGVVQKALNSLDSDSAVQFAQDWAKAMADMKAITDPIGATIKAITDPLETLRATMVKVGASTEDLNKLDEYRTLKLNEALKSQLSSLTGFLKALNGDNGGVSKLNQLQTDMTQFDAMKAKIAAGDKSVSQDDFTQLGQEILSLSGDVYGTSTQAFQDIRDSLISATKDFASSITAQFSATGIDTTATTTAIDATTAAVNAQTNAIVGQLTLITDYMKQTAANTAAANDTSYTSSASLIAKNGNYANTY